MSANPPFHKLDDELLYWVSDEAIGPIKAGSPIDLNQNGSLEVRISDWENPKQVHFNRVSLFSVTTEFAGDSIILEGYIPEGYRPNNDSNAFEKCRINLRPFPRQPEEKEQVRVLRSYKAVEPLATMPESGPGCQHLKIWPKQFDAIDRGTKTFEIRQNDRPFTIGTRLILHEYDPDEEKFTGRQLERAVTYITDWEQKPGFVVMAIQPF